MKSPHRRGQSLVEFAIVALMMYLMLAAIVEFGRMYFGAQTLQSTVDLAAREFARIPAPPDLTIAQGLSQGNVFNSIYDERFLVIDVQQAAQQYGDLMTYVNTQLPVVNRQLFPLMVYSQITENPGLGGTGGDTQNQSRQVLRFPGALVQDPNPSTAPTGALNDGFVVMVPIVTARDANTGAETIVWHRVLEASAFTATTPAADNYPLFIDGTQVTNGGLAALRLNYPFQAATMSSYPWNPTGATQPNMLNPNLGDDPGVVASDPGGVMGNQQPVAPGYSPLYEGEYGLGGRYAVSKVVRPFRKTISCQAVYRREVYGPATSSSN
jgi:hypothetical protein